jgi:hypothetical protein
MNKERLSESRNKILDQVKRLMEIQYSMRQLGMKEGADVVFSAANQIQLQCCVISEILESEVK